MYAILINQSFFLFFMSHSRVLDLGRGDSLKLLLHDTLKKGKQCLVFVNSKRSAEKEAEVASGHLNHSSPELADLSEKVLRVLGHPTVQCTRLANCIRGGTAFHHAGLHHDQRELVEDAFRSGIIKVIASTPTLAMGLDLPAFRSIIRDAKRYTRNGMEFIPVLEYAQMCGRAGRPRFDSCGEAILIASSESDRDILLETFVRGTPEDILSKLAVEPVLRTYVLSLVASGVVRTMSVLKDFFRRTFWSFQFQDEKQLFSILERVGELLVEKGFLIVKGDSLSATLLGSRVAELYIDPLTASHLLDCCDSSLEKPSALALLQVVNTCMEARPLLNFSTKEFDDLSERSSDLQKSMIVSEPSMFDGEYEDYLQALKTSFFFADWIDEVSEEELLERYKSRPGETRARIATLDWLLYSFGELSRMQKKFFLVSEIQKLRVRLEYGAKEELLPLLDLRGVGRVRARVLFRNGIKNMGILKATSLESLSQLLGPAVAKSILSQVRDEVEKVPDGKRKGQLGLSKFDED